MAVAVAAGPLHAAPHYLASLRLQVADWNSAVRLWEIQPTHLSPDGARTSLAAATFGVFMGLQQVADLLPKGDAAYVRGMTRCSDAVAETAVPVPANWQEHTGEAAQQRD